MELIEGKTLREILRSGPVALPKTLQLAAQLVDGLSKAHEAGIVHRDLKPENFMINKDGFAKILDFLAKISVEKSEEVRYLSTQLHTEAGVILGTSGYMSPERQLVSLLIFTPINFHSVQSFTK